MMPITDPLLRHAMLTTREKVFEQLYKEAFPLFARFVSRMGGSFSDASDVFQDALIVFYEKVTEGQLQVQVSAKAYVLGIAKHLWNRKFRELQKHLPLDALEKDIAVPEDFYIQPENSRNLLPYLEKAGKKCMEMLQSFYYQKMSMQDIARSFGFGSARSATVQKYKCLEKVRQQIKKADHEEIFA